MKQSHVYLHPPAAEPAGLRQRQPALPIECARPRTRQRCAEPRRRHQEEWRGVRPHRFRTECTGRRTRALSHDRLLTVPEPSHPRCRRRALTSSPGAATLRPPRPPRREEPSAHSRNCRSRDTHGPSPRPRQLSPRFFEASPARSEARTARAPRSRSGTRPRSAASAEHAESSASAPSNRPLAIHSSARAAAASWRENALSASASSAGTIARSPRHLRSTTRCPRGLARASGSSQRAVPRAVLWSTTTKAT